MRNTMTWAEIEKEFALPVKTLNTMKRTIGDRLPLMSEDALRTLITDAKLYSS